MVSGRTAQRAARSPYIFVARRARSAAVPAANRSGTNRIAKGTSPKIARPSAIDQAIMPGWS
jgi:hypothetical protein